MTPVHELLHTLGFVHEHTRPDRDDFISINFDNIEPGEEKNFEKRPHGTSDFFEKGSVDTKDTPYDVLSLLHYRPQDFSKDGEDVLTYLHGLPDQTWPEPEPEDPLSAIDQVELAMAYNCSVSQEKLLQYIHFNRHYNTLLIQHNTKLINQLRTNLEQFLPGFSNLPGELWIGLDKLHQLTSARSYSLKITMTDYDGKKYTALFEQFQVGQCDGYVLKVGGFNAAHSTLGDSLTYHNGMKFGTKDRDQDGASSKHCAQEYTSGWWYKYCHLAHPTGLSSATKKYGDIYVNYKHGGERGTSYDSWSEAEFLLVPN